jgi:hypothetical protein
VGPIISAEIEEKISRDDHGNISVKEVNECFSNHNGRYCTEHRAEHLPESGAPSLWFVAATNHGRELKVMFVFEDGKIFLKSAYPATTKVKEIFARHAR